jgi:membrane-bound lytic murein transglycosylase D
MQLPLLALILQLAASPAELPMPPPPPGMKALAPKDAPAPAVAQPDADDDTPDDDSKKASEELEEMRAAEQVAIDPSAQPAAQTLQNESALGIASPLRARMEDGLEDWGQREDASPLDLPRVTNLAALDVGSVAKEYDIPIEMQPLVAQYVRFFEGPGRRWFRTWMNRSARYIPMMKPILEAAGIPGDTVYLAMIESGFSTEASSWAHAVGPWQFIAATGKTFGLHQDFWLDERRDPLKATAAAARYLKQLHAQLGNWELAWAAYNTGGGRIQRMMRKKGTDNFWEISDGRGLATETKQYVPKLIACALVAKHPQAFGFADSEFEYEKPLEFEEVKVVDPTDLEIVARAAGVSVNQVKELNPALKRWCTPPADEAHPFVLRLPLGSAKAYAENIAKIAPRERLTYAVHKVKRGDTLSRIALSYHSAPEAILQINHLKNPRALWLNSELVIPVPRGTSGVALARMVTRAQKSGVVVSAADEVPAGAQVQPAVARGKVKTEQVGGRTRLSYGVEDGDSLWTIAQRFGCSVDDLRRWNHLNRHSRLQIGAVLNIYPGPSAVTPTDGSRKVADANDAHRRTVQLSQGETLWSLAQRYGVSVDDLKRWNGITEVRAVRAGQPLTVIVP